MKEALETTKKLPDYLNSELPIDKRVEDLFLRMTLEEKVAQTMSIFKDPNEYRINVRDDDTLDLGDRAETLKCGIGSYQKASQDYDSFKTVRFANAIQKYLKENTRLGIPAIIHEECLHGHECPDSTIFPVPLALASSWDTELIEKTFSVIAKEVRVRGGHQVFAPVLDIGRDPRWGRIEETFGEDTCLTTEMGVAAVTGLQGKGPNINKEHVAAGIKHMVGYGQTNGGRNFSPADIPKRILIDQILPPFKAAVKRAGVLGVMPSHGDIDGVPCHSNRELLTNVLRNEWGFTGIVVSDYNDVIRLHLFHNIAESTEEAAALALSAGVDMDLPSGGSYKTLINYIKSDSELQKHLDNSVKRILRLKFLLGLFDEPYDDPNRAKKVVFCEEHRKFAKEVANKCITLLKNDNNLLPLDINKVKRMAVIGPTAHPVNFGNYSIKPFNGKSILEGMKELAKGKFEILYAKGCHITRHDENPTTTEDRNNPDPGVFSLNEELDLIKEAEDLAKKSDVAVVCIGGNNLTAKEATGSPKSIGDRASIELLGNQNELLRKIVETGTPVIVVVMGGRPLNIEYAAQHAHAIFQCWYLGYGTGEAIVGTIFGNNNPGGKLPLTMHRSVGHLPVHYSQKPMNFFKGYLFSDNSCLFPFGYGLSYTTFQYDKLNISPKKLKMGETGRVIVEVTNTGRRKGDEVVQLYIRDLFASVTRPIKELKAFKRITLEPGETKIVQFEITPDMLEFTGIDYMPIMEPGTFEVMVGTSSIKYLTERFELIE